MNICARCLSLMEKPPIIRATTTFLVLADVPRGKVWVCHNLYEWTRPDTIIPTTTAVEITKENVEEVLEAIEKVFPDYLKLTPPPK